MTPLAPADVLSREFAQIHCRILDLAAALDRVARAGDCGGDPRWSQIDRCLAILAQAGSERAEGCQMAFSLPYDPQWRSQYGV